MGHAMHEAGGDNIDIAWPGAECADSLGHRQRAKSGKNHILIVLLCDNLSTIYKIKYYEMESFSFFY